MRRPPRVLDLFAGAGGLSAGFGAAGYEIVGAVELDGDAAATFQANHPRTRVAQCDIRTMRRKQFTAVVGGGVDVIIGGPPCQGFSVNGPRGPGHPSAELLFEFARAVEVLKPAAFLIENVPGLLTYRGGYLIDSFMRRLHSISVGRRRYTVVFDVLDAAGYGVPQRRQRVFVCGVRHGAFRFPSPSSERISLIDAIGDLPEWTSESADEPFRLPASFPLTPYQRARRRRAAVTYNHSAKRLQEHRLKRLAHLVEGDDKRVLPPDLQAGGRNGKYRRLRSSAPAPTIVAHMAHDTAAFIHPRYNRMLTVREAARLQSFDDRYRFFGSQYSQFRQVGNSVPPLLAGALARALMTSLHPVFETAATADRRSATA